MPNCLYRWLLACCLVAGPATAQKPDVYGQVKTDKTRATTPYGSRADETVSPSTAADPPGPLFDNRPPGKIFSWPRHTHPDDPRRHVGLGHPLIGTSWRNRPLQIGWLVGGLFGNDLIAGRVSRDTTLLGGYRVGWDFDHYWGCELRWAFANGGLRYPQNVTTMGPSAEVQFLDVSLMYYPWGDARWRPFFSLGLGAARFRFKDDQQRDIGETPISLPIGLGVKYLWKDWLALRAEFTDTWSFASGEVGSLHNLSLTCGAEIRWGGTRTSYFPFHPGRTMW